MRANVKSYIDRAWNSPTLMTWMSYFTKSASVLLITPSILVLFSEIEIVIWYLFAAFMSMSGLADFGFRNTFVRYISYANGGATSISEPRTAKNIGETNWDLIGKLYSHMHRIYLVLSVILFIGLVVGGYYSIRGSASKAENEQMIWISWGIMAACLSIDFYCKVYINYMEGLNKIALVRRVEAFFKLFIILLSFASLKIFHNVLSLSAAISFGYILNTTRNAILARRIYDGKLKTLPKHAFEWEFFREIWKPAWKSGVSGILSVGLINFSTVIYAQIGDPKLVASYMFAVRILLEVRFFANAPFYSKIPLLAKLRIGDDHQAFVKLAKSGMKKSHFIFAFAIACGVFGQFALDLIGSKIDFIDLRIWMCLSLAFYVHLYGALHMHLYMTGNHIISHIADSVSGIIFISTALLLLPFIGIYSLPVGLLAGYLGFYSWYAARHSLKALKTSFFQFEKDTSLPFLSGLLLIYTFVFFFLS